MRRVSLDELEAVPIGNLAWRPLRRALGATAFGTRAWAAEGEDLAVLRERP